MTIAKEIQMTSHNANDALHNAEILAIETTQDWENEQTIFEFEDKTCLVVCGSDVSAYGCKDDIKFDNQI